jgi:hypothetical protein
MSLKNADSFLILFLVLFLSRNGPKIEDLESDSSIGSITLLIEFRPA